MIRLWKYIFRGLLSIPGHNHLLIHFLKSSVLLVASLLLWILKMKKRIASGVVQFQTRKASNVLKDPLYKLHWYAIQQ